MAGGVDINQLMRKAAKLQEQLAKRKEELELEEYQGVAGGLVTAVVTGAYDVKSVRIDPKALEGNDLSMVEDLVVAALNQAISTSRERMQGELKKLTGGMAIPGL